MTHHSPITNPHGDTRAAFLAPPVDTRAAVDDGIFGINTLAAPDATSDEEWAQLVEVRGAKAVADLERIREAMPTVPFRVECLRELAVDLLTMHEDTGISLDAWVAAREFVEAYTGPIDENGA